MENKVKFMNTAKGILKEHDIEADTVDLNSIYEKGLSIEENIELLPVKSLKTKKDIEVEESKVLDENIKIAKMKQDKLKKEWKKDLMKTLSKPSSQIIERYFTTIMDSIDIMINSPTIHGVAVVSETGMGKSFTITKHLINNLKLKEGKDFIIYNGYVTPLKLFQVLQENHNKIILIDDIGTLFSDTKNVSLLLSALWDITGKRLVSYRSTTKKMNDLNLEETVDFTGKMIFCLNDFPKKLKNIQSRLYFFDMEFSYKDKIAMCYDMAKVNNIPIEVVDYIEKITTKANTKKINLRLVIKLNQARINKKDWKRIANDLLSVNKTREIVAELMDLDIPYDDKIKRFKEETNKSRRTFDSIKKKME